MNLNPIRKHGLAALAVLGLMAACGGNEGAGDPEPPRPPLVAVPGALAAARPGDLAAWAQGRLQRLDAQGALGLGTVFGAGMPMPAPADGAAAAPPSSRTLVQEDGVDEADLMRVTDRTVHALVSDGSSLALLAQSLGDDGELDAGRRVALSHDGSRLVPEGLLANSDGSALVAVSRESSVLAGGDICAECMTIAPVWMTSSVQVQRIDTRDPRQPVAGARLSIEGALVDARRVGDLLVLVAVHRPVLAAQALPAGASRALRSAAIAGVTGEQLLPRLRRNGGPYETLLSDTDCWLQPDNGSSMLQLTTVTLIDLTSPELPQTTRCFAGGTEAIYLTPGNLWLATTRSDSVAPGAPSPLPPPLMPLRTDIHQLAIDATGTGGLSWKGSATVVGHLGWDSQRKSYRLSEHEGHLRVLTFTGDLGWGTLADAASVSASPARLTVLRADSAASSADGRTLATVGVLPNERRPAAIGKPNEQVFAVRFAGPRGYVVTFRRIDPLYVLDLTDPADPFVAGEVELPGFSQTLLPLDNGLLLGLGRAADAFGMAQGLQLTLFDVADATAPRVLQNLMLGEAGSSSALEYARHGLAMRMDAGVARLALPVELTTSAWSDRKRSVQTFAVDTEARTLSLRERLGPVDSIGVPGWLGDERAALVGERVIHLRGGALTTYAW